MRESDPLAALVARTERGLAPRGDFMVRVRCDNTTRHRNWKCGGSNTQTECLWEPTVAVAAATRSSAGISFAFDIPGNGLATGSRGEAGCVSWTLEIRAPMDGIDYVAEFPVRMPGRSRSAAGTVATKGANTVGASRRQVPYRSLSPPATRKRSQMNIRAFDCS
jgi:hypothetical protein